MLTNDDLTAIERVMEKKIKPLRSKLNKVQKDINAVVNVFDSDIVDLQNRTDKLETAVFMRG
ncbi:MAG: hypothetical protein WA061_04805 [Microgenomates group bacterium]